MGTNLQNNLIVQFLWDVTTASASVAISNDIERDQVVTASWCYAVLRNKTGSKIERVKGNAAAWTFTFTKRGLDQSDSDVEVPALKKAWKTGQTMYITLLSSQIVDKQNSNTYGTGTTQTMDNLAFTGTQQGRVFASLVALNAAYPTPANGLVDMYCTAEWQYYFSSGWTWNAVANGTNPNGSESVAGKFQQSTQVAFDAWTDLGSTGAQNVPKNSQVKAAITGVTVEQFGDGSDGAVVISTNTTLTRDMYYTDLTINAGQTLFTNWYRIFGTGTLSGTGTINNDGWNGWNASGVTGGTAWAKPNDGTLFAAVAGLTGATWAGWGWTAGTNWIAQTWFSNVSSAWGGAGSAWQSGGWWTASTGATSTRWEYYNLVLSPKNIIALLQLPASPFTLTPYKVSAQAWSGAAGWWAGGVWDGGWGGGSGSSWGMIFIAFKTINFTGTITAKWGNGGNGGNGWTNSWGWGWGAWGNWWVIYYIYKTLTSIGTTVVTWGAAWSGWVWNWTGNWSAGTAGWVWVVQPKAV